MHCFIKKIMGRHVYMASFEKHKYPGEHSTNVDFGSRYNPREYSRNHSNSIDSRSQYIQETNKE
jgi:hypothetical protein